jgi:hypothetical protein
MLELNGITKSYGTHRVLDDVSFTVAPAADGLRRRQRRGQDDDDADHPGRARPGRRHRHPRRHG